MIEGGMEGWAMPSPVELREDYSAEELPGAGPALEGRQSESTAFVAGCGAGWDGSRIGCQDRRDGSPDAARLVHRFNADGPEGLINNRTEGPKPRLSAERLAQLATIVETGADRERDGVVRWRRVDLKRVIAERFGVELHER
jgi:hypothetical protein